MNFHAHFTEGETEAVSCLVAKLAFKPDTLLDSF